MRALLKQLADLQCGPRVRVRGVIRNLEGAALGDDLDPPKVAHGLVVIAHRRPDTNWADLAGLRDAPEAHGLISVNEDAWPQTPGPADMRAVVSLEADNPDSVRWYAHEVLRLREDHPAWQDMERQLGNVNDRPRRDG